LLAKSLMENSEVACSNSLWITNAKRRTQSTGIFLNSRFYDGPTVPRRLNGRQVETALTTSRASQG
jgi:hypothetical protein